MKIITIGGATYDILIQYNDAEMLHRTTATGAQSLLVLEEGKKLEVDNVVYKTGGGATNSAVSFKRLGFDVAAFFKIGNDYQGQFIADTLANEGVHTNLAQKTHDAISSVSFVICGPSSDRTLLVYRGAARTMQESELPLQQIEQADCVYISALSGNGALLLPLIAHTAKKAHTLVVVNPGSKQLKTDVATLHAALSNIDVLMLNTFESKLLMYSLVVLGKHTQPLSTSQYKKSQPQKPTLLQAPLTYQDARFTLSQYISTIHALGPRIVVITNGSEGVYVATHDTLYFHPSIPAKVTSTLGAGDAFGSGFTAGIVSGKPVDDAIRMGVLNSAAVIGHSDAKTGLLTQEVMEQKLNELDKGLLQSFALANSVAP